MFCSYHHRLRWLDTTLETNIAFTYLGISNEIGRHELLALQTLDIESTLLGIQLQCLHGDSMFNGVTWNTTNTSEGITVH